MAKFNPVSEAVLAELTAVLPPDQISTAEAERQLRAQDMSQHDAHPSEVVLGAALARTLAPGGQLLLHGYRPEQVALGTGGPPDPSRE